MLILASILIQFQQKHSPPLCKEVIKIKTAECICHYHASKLIIGWEEKNY